MTIEQIRAKVAAREYSTKSHVVSHMLAEGFESNHCEAAILSGRVIEEYPEESRCLVLGYFNSRSEPSAPFTSFATGATPTCSIL